ncbi:MAG: electron transfer flavoprotein subunit alpha/FixB family protein [Oscillospiraceae bacterium]|jgi:electron transfer flavoprotein alpha subunit
MKKIIVCFPDELRSAAGLVARANALPGETLLWVPGGLGAFPPAQTGAEQIVEISFTNQTVLNEPGVCASALFELFDETPDVALTAASPRGDALAAQLSLLLGGACVTAAKALFTESGTLVVRRAVYAGNLDADFAVDTFPLCISLLPGGEDAAPVKAPKVTAIRSGAALPDWLTDIEDVQAEKPDALSRARVVVAAGRGAGNKAKLETLAALADMLGGILGGSRPLICDGKLPPERQLGISGTQVSPDLCLVFGASGAAAFRAGVDGSKKLIAINRDPDAAIFSGCDIGVVADSAEFADALIDALQKQ